MSQTPLPPPQPTWSPEVRSWVSLLLFIHLFAVVIGVTTYTRPSPLQEQLHELFAPYLRTLHLAAYPISYPFARFHLTHAAGTDVDYVCEVATSAAEGPEEFSIPARGLQPLVRYRRYQALANATGTLAASEVNDEFNSILPKSIAGAVLKRRQATEGTVRVEAHFLPEIELMEESAAKRRAEVEKVRTVYEAQVFVAGNTIELLKKSATLEVAPVEPASKAAPQRKSSAPQ